MNSITVPVAAATPPCPHPNERRIAQPSFDGATVIEHCGVCDTELVLVDGRWTAVEDASATGAIADADVEAVANGAPAAGTPMLTLIDGGKPKPTVPGGASALNPATATDEQIPEILAMLESARRDMLADIDPTITAFKVEAEKRLRAKSARVIGEGRFQIELVEKWSVQTDLEKMKAAAAVLPEADRPKLIEVVPETVIPRSERVKSTAMTSINALVKKYGVDSKFGQLVSVAYKREMTGTSIKL